MRREPTRDESHAAVRAGLSIRAGLLRPDKGPAASAASDSNDEIEETQLAQYMMLIYYPAGEDRRRREGGLTPEEMAEEGQRWRAFAKELEDAGALVSSTGLQGVDAATTVRVRDSETEISDGPFAVTDDVFAGCWLIEADDLDMALHYAARVPAAAHGCVEVRPTWGT
jgi:hypothetical protein